jgi:hypothetical protein
MENEFSLRLWLLFGYWETEWNSKEFEFSFVVERLGVKLFIC